MSLAPPAVCFPGDLPEPHCSWIYLMKTWQAVGGWRWEAGERRGEKVPRVRFLLLNIVESDLQHSIMWYLDAGRGVKYRIPPFGILEGLYNVLFLFDSGEKVNRLLGRLVWVFSAIQSSLSSSLTHLPTQGCSVNHVCKGRCPFEPKNLLSSKILLILWFYK